MNNREEKIHIEGQDSIPDVLFQQKNYDKDRKIKIQNLPNNQGFVAYGVFSDEECLHLIETGEELQFNSLEKIYSTNYRNNKRIIVRSDSLADILGQRLLPYLEDEIVIDGTNDTILTDYDRFGSWKLAEMNPIFRLCKYDENNFFRVHYDEGYDPSKDKITIKTCMLYLNDNFDGGETVFYNEDSSEMFRLKPEPGMVLVFNQRILHEGTTVTKGNKYFIRTDIFYDCIEHKIPEKYTENELKAIKMTTDYKHTNIDMTIEEEMSYFKRIEKLINCQDIDRIIFKE